jgi:hypothetical protein
VYLSLEVLNQLVKELLVLRVILEKEQKSGKWPFMVIAIAGVFLGELYL